LVERALARGARDNVTVVVVRALDEEQVTKTQLNPSVAVEAGVSSDDDDPTALK
jgi:serine/threonine protein phosphatase PrpC